MISALRYVSLALLLLVRPAFAQETGVCDGTIQDFRRLVGETESIHRELDALVPDVPPHVFAYLSAESDSILRLGSSPEARLRWQSMTRHPEYPAFRLRRDIEDLDLLLLGIKYGGVRLPQTELVEIRNKAWRSISAFALLLSAESSLDMYTESVQYTDPTPQMRTLLTELESGFIQLAKCGVIALARLAEDGGDGPGAR